MESKKKIAEIFDEKSSFIFHKKQWSWGEARHVIPIMTKLFEALYFKHDLVISAHRKELLLLFFYRI